MLNSVFSLRLSGSARPAGSGFTLIELLIVLSISLTLAAIAAPSVLTAIRRAQVDKGMGTIVEAANEARLLSRRYSATTGSSTGSLAMYGVRIIDRPSDPPTRVEVWTRAADGSGTPERLEKASGEPVFAEEVPSNAIIMTYDAGADSPIDLRSHTPVDSTQGVLEWWYQPLTGRVLHDPANTQQLGAVGLPGVEIDPTIAGDRLPDGFGREYNRSTRDVHLWVAQSNNLDYPGLWVRDTSNTYGIALRVYPTGIIIRDTLDVMPGSE